MLPLAGMGVYVFDDQSDQAIFEYVNRYNNFSPNQKQFSGRLYHCMAKQVSNTDPSCKLLH